MLLEYKSMTISSPDMVKSTDEILNGKLHFCEAEYEIG